MAKRKSNSKQETASSFAFGELDRVFHEKARLGILTALVSSSEELNFTDLKDLCALTDGNLNRHLKVLIEAEIVAVRKSGQGRNTNSDYRLTGAGRKAFLKYISQLEDVVRQAQALQPETKNEKAGADGLAYEG